MNKKQFDSFMINRMIENDFDRRSRKFGVYTFEFISYQSLLSSLFNLYSSLDLSSSSNQLLSAASFIQSMMTAVQMRMQPQLIYQPAVQVAMYDASFDAAVNLSINSLFARNSDRFDISNESQFNIRNDVNLSIIVMFFSNLAQSFISSLQFSNLEVHVFRNPTPAATTEFDLSRELINLSKMYYDEVKYSGKKNSLIYKLTIFANMCARVSLSNTHHARIMAFPIMLREPALAYFYNNICMTGPPSSFNECDEGSKQYESMWE